MNQYPFENLNDEEFENLIIRIAKELLGVGCKTFSAGKDGAKDGWFEGKAENYPSKNSPWSGKFNLQAKHTKNYNSSCSDNDFYINQSSVLNKEIVRLKEVMKTTPFDNYIIFTNRKLTGSTHPTIIEMLRNELGIKNVEIIGREQIDTYLNDYPQIAHQFGLSKFQAPLRFYEKDLKKVIIIFSQQSKAIVTEANNYITSFTIIEKEKKNELNNLSKEYFDFIIKHSLQYFGEIEKFLRNPNNIDYQKMYSKTVGDLQEVIIIDRTHFNKFEHILKHLNDYIVQNNEDILIDLRDIVRVFIHFMYFNCDIGKKV